MGSRFAAVRGCVVTGPFVEMVVERRRTGTMTDDARSGEERDRVSCATRSRVTRVEPRGSECLARPRSIQPQDALTYASYWEPLRARAEVSLQERSCAGAHSTVVMSLPE
jgi:hypothetical protein